MHYSVLVFLFFIISFHFSFGQNSSNNSQKESYKYYDKDDNVISESEFSELYLIGGFYTVQSDSLRIIKLTPTKEKGRLDNKTQLIIHLEKLTGRQIDDKKPIILIYHPGKDACNSSGSATESSKKIWFSKLEKGTKRIAKTEPIYICKSYEELKESDKVLHWHEDIGKTIEKQFFKFHYPCSSFVIIAEDGEFFSSFGEFGKEYLWKMLKEMK